MEKTSSDQAGALTLSILEEAPAYHRWILDRISPFLGKRTLEIGCGIGNLTGLLLEHGKVIAADVNEDYLRKVAGEYRDHVNFEGTLLWDIRQTPPESLKGAIDTILCSNVLEHVEDDESVLRRFSQLLPVNGRLIVLVPALKVLYNAFDRELGHFQRYGKEELRQKLTRNGFWIRSLEYFNLFGILGWFINGSLLRRRILPAGQVRLFDRIVPILSRAEKMIPSLAGQSLIGVGIRDERGGFD